MYHPIEVESPPPAGKGSEYMVPFPDKRVKCIGNQLILTADYLLTI